jgi:hypothetical protein
MERSIASIMIIKLTSDGTMETGTQGQRGWVQ